MPFLCTRSCFNKQFFEEDVVYDSIGDSSLKHFKEVEADEGEVFETGLPDNRDEVKAELDKLGVDYNGRLGLAKLQALLGEAQTEALNS
jgi:hypothetical protein